MRSRDNEYAFESFIEEVKNLSYVDIIKTAEAEANRVEARSYGVKGAPRARERGSVTYVRRLGAFLFWLRDGTRPAGATEDDWNLYRTVAEKLVEKKQFKPEILDGF